MKLFKNEQNIKIILFINITKISGFIVDSKIILYDYFEKYTCLKVLF